MKFNQKMMMNLAVIAVIMSVMITGTNGKEKVTKPCCTSVSTANITSPITGFRIQKRDPPCVRAVIFYTDEGQFCMNKKLKWVKQKVMELSKQNSNMKMNSNVSTPLSRTSS